MQVFDITAIGRQGDGIAEGWVFVPDALPGVRVAGVVEGDRLSNMRILRPSPDRVKPACRRFSYDPTSSAGDAVALAGGGLRLDLVQVVDQFRWSPHTELAARFSRPHKRGN